MKMCMYLITAVEENRYTGQAIRKGDPQGWKSPNFSQEDHRSQPPHSWIEVSAILHSLTIIRTLHRHSYCRAG